MPVMHSKTVVHDYGENPDWSKDPQPEIREEEMPDYRAVYRAVDYSGAFGLENMLNKFTQEGWSIHKILPTGTVTDFGIVVFERWVTDGTDTASTEATSTEVSGEDSRPVQGGGSVANS